MKVQIVCLIMTQQAINRIKKCVYTWVGMNFQGKFQSFSIFFMGCFELYSTSNGVHSVIYPYSATIIHIKTILHSIVGNHNNIIHGSMGIPIKISKCAYGIDNYSNKNTFSWILVGICFYSIIIYFLYQVCYFEYFICVQAQNHACPLPFPRKQQQQTTIFGQNYYQAENGHEKV